MGASTIDKIAGHLEVGINDRFEVVINLDRDMTGHIIFSPNQARDLGALLLKKAHEAEAEMPKKVFRLTDEEWWLAPTLEHAIVAAMRETGLSREEVADEDAGEVSKEDLQRLKFRDDDGISRTFEEELQRRIEAGCPIEMFASTNY